MQLSTLFYNGTKISLEAGLLQEELTDFSPLLKEELKGRPVGTQTRTRSDRKSIIKRPHTRNGRQYNVCHY